MSCQALERDRGRERVPEQVPSARGAPLKAPARRRTHRPGELGAAPRPARAAITAARHAGRLGFDEPARRRWWELYPTLTEPHPGLAGAVCARAEAHVVRLALIYALLDQANEIGLAHLQAALTLWEYAARSRSLGVR